MMLGADEGDLGDHFHCGLRLRLICMNRKEMKILVHNLIA